MAFRITALGVTALLILATGCDPAPQSAAAPAATATTAPTTPTTASPAASLNGPRHRIALASIPFSLEVPEGWSLQPGVTGRPVLQGRIPSGEVDVLLGVGPSVKADNLPLLIKQSAKASNDRHVQNVVIQRDNMTIVKNIAPQLPPNVPPSSDPALIPMGWTVQCLVSDGKLDYSAYELTIMGLSQDMFDRDEAFLQSIIDSLRFEPASNRPATP